MNSNRIKYSIFLVLLVTRCVATENARQYPASQHESASVIAAADKQNSALLSPGNNKHTQEKSPNTPSEKTSNKQSKVSMVIKRVQQELRSLRDLIADNLLAAVGLAASGYVLLSGQKAKPSSKPSSELSLSQKGAAPTTIPSQSPAPVSPLSPVATPKSAAPSSSDSTPVGAVALINSVPPSPSPAPSAAAPLNSVALPSTPARQATAQQSSAALPSMVCPASAGKTGLEKAAQVAPVVPTQKPLLQHGAPCVVEMLREVRQEVELMPAIALEGPESADRSLLKAVDLCRDAVLLIENRMGVGREGDFFALLNSTKSNPNITDAKQMLLNSILLAHTAIERGANVNQLVSTHNRSQGAKRSMGHHTYPLFMYAIRQGCPSAMMNVLIENANVELPDNAGRSALWAWHNYYYRFLQVNSRCYGHTEDALAVLQMLFDKKTPFAGHDSSHRNLLCAITRYERSTSERQRKCEHLQRFLDAGADILEGDKLGRTVLHFLGTEEEYNKIAQYLVNQGADWDPDRWNTYGKNEEEMEKRRQMKEHVTLLLAERDQARDQLVGKHLPEAIVSLVREYLCFKPKQVALAEGAVSEK